MDYKISALAGVYTNVEQVTAMDVVGFALTLVATFLVPLMFLFITFLKEHWEKHL